MLKFFMKRILVAGGAGFLGSHLCEKLLQQGNAVICVDNFYTGREENLLSFIDNPRFECISHDICLPLNIKVDEIYNFACPASPVHYQRNPIQTTKTNVIGSLNLLELAQRLGCKIFQASTSEVYGDPSIHPQIESYWGHVNPIGQRSCYDEGKRCAETLFSDYHRLHGIDVKIARIFNTYGPRMDPNDGRVVSNFIVQAIKNESITVYGEGAQTRSLCYVDDLIAAIIQIMGTAKNVMGPFNIGNPNELTIIDLAKKIIELTGAVSSIEFLPLPFDDPKQRCPDIQFVQRALNWTPLVSLDQGLMMTIAYFRKQLKLSF